MKLLQWIAVFGLVTLISFANGTAQASSACRLTGDERTRCCTPDLAPTWWCPANQLESQPGACSLKPTSRGPAVRGDLYSCATDIAPPPQGGAGYRGAIIALAADSACAKTTWKNRGRAPAGYTKGMALTFARSLCRLYEPTLASPATVMSKANTGVTSKDALAHYASVFSSLRMEVSPSGPDPLLSLYTLGMGLGMRESTGRYCVGWDTTAGANRSSSQAEAGLFQTSYNSMAASAELSKLYAEYRANPERCLLDVFKEGASCATQSILGTGAGADYQRFSKACPAFSAEYAMIMLRVLRSHYGPINRREAQVILACENMLEKVKTMVQQDPKNVCSELF